MATREEEPLKEQKTKPRKTFKEKLKYLRENITLEPVLACSVVPSTLSRLATQNLNLDKACRVNLNFGDVVCDALIAKQGKKYEKEELAVQALISMMEGYRNILLTAIPSFLILFLGAWSDRTRKRKMCILLPIFGDFLACLSNILNTFYFHELPVQVTMFFEAFLPAITGGWITTYMGAFSYISDISTKESRTFRVGVANLCFTAGSPIGSALSGILLNQIGYYGVFTLSSMLFLFSIVYGLIYIKDPEMPVSEKKVEEEPTGCFQFLKSFFQMKHAKNTLVVAFKKGPNHRRTKSILILASIAFIYGPAYGEFTVRYLFTRYRFNWDALKYSFYNTFYICIHALGALISISIFSRRLQWDDSVLGLMSNLSKIVGGMATGLARNSYHMYIAVVIETFNATSFTAMRSISSKLVSSDELGKMIAVFNLTEVLTSMVFAPIYSWIYMVTLQIDAGIVFYLSSILTIPPIIIFMWFFIQHRKSLKEAKPHELEQIENEVIKEQKEHKEDLISSINLADSKIFIE